MSQQFIARPTRASEHTVLQIDSKLQYLHLLYPAHVQLLQAITLSFGYTTVSWVKRYHPALDKAIAAAASAAKTGNVAAYLDGLQGEYLRKLNSEYTRLI